MIRVEVADAEAFRAIARELKDVDLHAAGRLNDLVEADQTLLDAYGDRTMRETREVLDELGDREWLRSNPERLGVRWAVTKAVGMRRRQARSPRASRRRSSRRKVRAPARRSSDPDRPLLAARAV